MTAWKDEIKQEQARRFLLHFTKATYRKYKADPAHELIAGTLDRVARGEIKRLMVFAPPQHGKSELMSRRFTAYHLARRPDDPVIITSYAAALAHQMSRHARDIAEGPEYARLYPDIKVDPTSRARGIWSLRPPHKGQLVAAGVGGPIVGHGAALGIIDDPFENWEQAQSETYREKAWDWYRGTFRTRIWEGGAIILVMTRWHEDDLAGRLLLDQGDRWHVLRLPALAETQDERDARNKKMGLPLGQPDPLGRAPGEPLCPSRFSALALEEIRADVGDLVWTAQYQGAPTAPEGNRFKRAWFPIVDAVPAGAKRVRYWDNAATAEGGKRTAGVLLAIAKGRVYIEDVVKGQWATAERNAIIKQTAELDHQKYGNHGKLYFEEEGGSSGKDASRAIIQHLAGYTVSADRPTGSKDVRLEPFRAQAQAGNAVLVRGKWNGEYIDEMCAIPNGRYRDQADATAGAYNKLTRGGWVRGSA